VSIPDPGPGFAGAVDLSALVNKAQAANQPAPAQTGAWVRDIQESEMGQIVELSNTVPVILEIYGQGVTPQLGGLIEKYGGKLLLATLDIDKAPQLVQALQIQGVPTVLAIIQGRPAPLFQGQAPEHEIAPVFDEVLKVAAQQGVTGVLPAPEAEDESEETPQEPQLSPELQRAEDALMANDLDGAEAAYNDILKTKPADSDAKAGLARVGLLKRIGSVNPDQVRAEAAQSPTSIQAALLVADLDVSGGHLDDAFSRLLGLFPGASPEDKDSLRERLLEYFEMAGPAHPSVVQARARLTSLMF